VEIGVFTLPPPPLGLTPAPADAHATHAVRSAPQHVHGAGRDMRVLWRTSRRPPIIRGERANGDGAPPVLLSLFPHFPLLSHRAGRRAPTAVRTARVPSA
jgi:hypothetical protein